MSPEDGTSGPPPGAASHHQTNPHDRDQVNTDSTAGVRQPAGYAEAYPIYLAGGWPSVLPLKGSTKEPPPGGFTGYKDRYPTHEEMEAWARRFPAGNIALRLPPMVVVLDVDHYGDKHGGDTLAEAERRWGALPPTYRNSARAAPSGHRFYRITEGTALAGQLGFAELGLGHVEILQWHHRYSVVYPSINGETGEMYRWFAPDGTEMDRPPAVEVLPELPARWVEELRIKPRTHSARPHNGVEIPTEGLSVVTDALTDGQMSQRVEQRLGRALVVVHGPNCRHDMVRNHVLALLRMGKQGEPGVDWALTVLRNAFVNTLVADGSRGEGEAEAEFRRFLTNPRAGALLSEPDTDGDGGYEQDVSVRLHRLRVDDEAKRRFAIERAGDAAPFDEGLLDEILARPEEPPFRIEGLVPSDSSTLVTALRKTGKTTLILNLAHSLTTGEYFLGRFPVRQITGRVGILNFEVSGAQIARWADETGIDHEALYLVNLRGQANPFARDDQRERLAGLLKAHEVESLIVDPFGKAYTGTNENDSGEVGAFLAGLDRFKTEIGAADLILTAHAGWAAERSRGSSALEDWPDSIITMVADEDDGVRYLRAMGRDVDLDEDELHYDPATRRLSLMCTGSRKHNRDQAKAEALVGVVCAQVQQHPGVSQKRIIELLQALHRERVLPVSFQERDVVKAITLALKAGSIRREGGGKGKAYRHFFIDQDQPPPTSAKPPPNGAAPPPPASSIRGGGGTGGGCGANHPGGGSPSGSEAITAPGSVEGTSLASPVEASASPPSPGGSHPPPGEEVLPRPGMVCRSCCQPKSRLSAENLCEACQDRDRSIGLL
jgi:AAA domain/Bifunctional DNA primase/polymerase, N-terminal